MATGRIQTKHYRVYQDGYDLSGFGRSIGPLEQTYEEIDMTAHMSDAVKGYLAGKPQINIGTLNAVFDNTATTGLHTVGITAGAIRTVLVAGLGYVPRLPPVTPALAARLSRGDIRRWTMGGVLRREPATAGRRRN